MKKKITALCLCVALLAVAVVGASLAYFTDTDKADNTFNAGSVKIKLIEEQSTASCLEDPGESFDGGCSYRRKHRSFTWDEYFSSQNKKTEILYRYSADSAHRIWAGRLDMVYRWTFLSRL